MKINVKQKDCKFIVKPDERMVICVIDGEWVRDLLTDFIRDFDFNDFQFFTTYKFDKKLELPRSFIGKAVCADEDEWDENLGRKIAYSRAKNKLYTSFFKRANLYVQAVDRRLNDVINRFNDLGASLDENKRALEENIEKHLQGIVTETEEE